MDSTLEKIYAISAGELQQYQKMVMLGSGQHGPCFVSGQGVRLTDINGKNYLDCTAQGWALLLGHANEEIRQVVYEQMGRLGHLNQNSGSLPRFALAKRLLELAPAGFDRVLFTVGGSAAIEAAMKIAVKNVPQGRKFITLEDGCLTGGLYSTVSVFTASRKDSICKVTGLGIPDRFIQQGKTKQLYHECGYDTESIARTIETLAGSF